MNTLQNTIPENWLTKQQNADGTVKKLMVYQTTIAFILENKAQAIQKIRDNMKLFEENREKILLVFSPHENCAELKRIDPGLSEQFEEIVKEFLERDFGIYDENHESEEMPECFDAYYGDASVLAHRCRNAGKPVMIENVV